MHTQVHACIYIYAVASTLCCIEFGTNFARIHCASWPWRGLCYKNLFGGDLNGKPILSFLIGTHPKVNEDGGRVGGAKSSLVIRQDILVRS